MQHIVLIGSAYPFRGGLAAFNERLAFAFQEQGYRVTLYTYTLQYPGFLFPGSSQFSEDPPPTGLDIRRRIHSLNPLNWLRAGREIRDLKPDLVVIKYWTPFMAPCFGTLLRRIKTNRHTRIVCILDNIIPHEKHPGDRALTRYFLKPVNAFIAMSREVLRDLRSFTAAPAQWVPHPIYDHYGPLVDPGTSRRHLELDPGGTYLLFFGFIRAYKGLDLLLQAMADPALHKSGLRLIIAGEFYEEEKPYRDLASRLGLESRLIWQTHFIPHEEVKYYFCAADLVVQPYRSATQSGISQMAYHFEIPMIVTRVGGLPEIVPDGQVGFVCEPQPSAIAASILRFFAEDRSEAFRARIREERKKFDWSFFTERILSLAQNTPDDLP